DSGGIRAEIDRQASRTDSASFRVLERSEYIALQVTREYLEYVLQQRIVSATSANLKFHKGIQGQISRGISAGTLTEADSQQVRERVLAAEARLKEAQEELATAEIRFLKLVGVTIGKPSMPGSISSALPKSLEAALESARTKNPRVHMARADVDAANAMVDAAGAKMGPEVLLEGRLRAGKDIDGTAGEATDAQVRVVAKWNLYRGGIDEANEQEQIRRASEQLLVLHQVHRELEEAVRESWERISRQASLAVTLRAQAAENKRLVSSYQEQFTVGQRSLLDVLDAQNTRFNVDVLAMTADFASLFAQYRLAAASGSLLSVMSLAPAKQSEEYARAEFNVPATEPVQVYARKPSRQENDLPLDLLARARKK
ncbi:MAG: TolC family protein, partial [Notoacmeibacter sp.]